MRAVTRVTSPASVVTLLRGPTSDMMWTNSHTSQASPADRSALVRCPAGSYATGGGGEVEGRESPTESRPVVDADGRPAGWQVWAEDGASTAFAVCAAGE